MIVLYKVKRNPGFGKVFLLVTFQKKAPVILEYLRFDQ